MIAYLVNTTLCALLLYVIYALLLENENRHFFKRIYMLAGLVFSLLVPFIVLDINIPKIPANLEMFYNIPPDETIVSGADQYYFAETATESGNSSSVLHVNYFLSLMVIYITITSLLVFRLLRNCRQMLIQVYNNDIVEYKGAKIVLVKEKIVPHSFGQYIFINAEDYYGGLVPEEIISHELAHVKQHHTYDILFIELLIAFGWFNPVFYLYRDKIRQNHEFLADEAVIGNNKAIILDYIAILLNYIPQNKKMNFTSNFNFIITKKRLVMMTKTTSKKRVWCSSIALIPVFIAAICVFSTKTVAQQNVSLPTQQTNGSAGILTQDDKLKEFNQIFEKCITEKDGRKMFNHSYFSKDDLNRMKELFLSMSSEQRDILPITFERYKAPDKKIPTRELFESWKDPAEYGVWLDDKRIENSELNRYQYSDFSLYYVSRLTQNAKNYGIHVYQLNLYTTANYNEMKVREEIDETLRLVPNIKRNTTQ